MVDAQWQLFCLVHHIEKLTRTKLRLSQEAVADRLGSSQSRVAKMEAGDASVSLDLLVRALVGLGATPNDVAKAIQTPKRRAE